MYEFPKYYEIAFGRRNFRKECDFIIKLIRKYSKIKVSNILDIGCGTGSHMLELAKLGFKVAGLDQSKKMLNETFKNLKNKLNLIGLYKKDMANFKLPIKFDACICMNNTLEILINNNQFISHFKSVAEHLNKGGLYIIEPDNPSFIFSNPLRKGIKKYKKKFKRGNTVITFIYKRYPFDLINFIEKNKLILDINDNGKKLRIVDDSPIRRLTPLDIDLIVRLNKRFEIIKILGGFNLKSLINDNNSKRMIIILRRV